MSVPLAVMVVGDGGLNRSKNVRFFFDDVRVGKEVEGGFGNVRLENGKGRDLIRVESIGNG